MHKVKMPKSKTGLSEQEKSDRGEEVFFPPSYYIIFGATRPWIFKPDKISMWDKLINFTQFYLLACLCSCNKITCMPQGPALGSHRLDFSCFRAKKRTREKIEVSHLSGSHFNSCSSVLTRLRRILMFSGKSINILVGSICKACHLLRLCALPWMEATSASLGKWVRSMRMSYEKLHEQAWKGILFCGTQI